MQINLKPTEVLLKEVRLSYVNLISPSKGAYSEGDDKYRVTFLLPKNDAKAKADIDAAIKEAYSLGVTKKWGGSRPAMKHPVYDGDGPRPSGEMFGEECRGHWVFTGSSNTQPEVVDAAGAKLIEPGQPVQRPSEVYSGMYVSALVNFYAYNNNGNRGIACGLGPMKKRRDGEPLGGAQPKASQVFDFDPADDPLFG